MRKHHTQMNESEKSNVRNFVKKMVFRINPYTKMRMAERKVSTLDLALTLSKGEVVEVHNDTPNEVRALFRFLINNKTCHVVVCINKPKVITCYWCGLEDRHSIVKPDKYNWNVNLVSVLANLRGNFAQ